MWVGNRVRSRSTGKKRDIETGIDYFGARYHSNGLGRWVSADWSSTPVPVPYANFGDPQSFNLYTYVRNLPTTRIDESGHDDSFSAALKAWWGEPTAAFSRFMSSKDGSQVGNSHPNPLTGVSTEEIVHYTNTKVGDGIDKMAAVLTAFDPTGQSGALRSYLKDDNLGLGLAIAGPFISLAGGEALNAAKAFGFKSFATAGGLVGGELESGGSALVNFSRSGSELGVTVSAVRGPAGTLSKIEQGAVNAARSQGASSVKIAAKMVKASMGRLLRKNGFTQEIKDGKATGNWTKTIKIQSER